MTKVSRLLSLACAASTVAGMAAAHPHIFIDTGLHPIFDAEGKLAAIRVIWTYDDLFSLTVLEDLKLDHDYDGALTPEEEAKLDGFDMNWIEGYQGDTYVLYEGNPVGLSRPLEHTATLVDGRIVTTHVRALDRRIDVGREPVVIQAYDPEFYTAYDLTLASVIEGREHCAAQLFAPKEDAQSQELLSALAELGADVSVADIGLPAVGARFAKEIRVTCLPL